MMLLGSMSHPNLLPYVACNYDEDGLLITDFAINGSMASHLHVALKDSDQPGLDWPTRLRIIQGVTKGLDYLNQQFPGLSLPHGHLSSSNNNEIEMIDLMDIRLRCYELDVSRRWDMRKVFEKIPWGRPKMRKNSYLFLAKNNSYSNLQNDLVF
nr:probable LRR receptor-like serine/threonine-protein kinase At4g31250 [Tanacetum cinerariifolium]